MNAPLAHVALASCRNTASSRLALAVLALLTCAACASEPTAPGGADAAGAAVDADAAGAAVDADADSAADAGDDADATADAGDDADATADAGDDADTTADATADADASASDTNDASDDASATDDADDTSASDATSDASDAVTDDTTADSDAGPPCTPTAPPTEVCDGVDNDCDGSVDQGGDGQPIACSDGDACSAGDACKDGKCAPGTPMVCDDGEACTDDACDKATGCVTTANAAACDDGDVCTSGEACSGGACVGGSVKVCDDGNSCTVDSCDKAKGCVAVACVAEACGKGCDDGDPCTSGDACSGGACKAGGKACDDGDACTADSCDSKTGICDHAAIAGCKACKVAGDCDDGNACTSDACSGGACKASPIAGCVGPTDYALLSFVPAAPKQQLPPGTLKFTFEIENLGKPYGGTFSGKLKWALLVSDDDKFDAGDSKLHSEPWDGYNIGAGSAATKASRTVQLGFAGSSAEVQNKVLAAKFLCLSLSDGGDANLSNNALCIANPVVAQALALVKLVVSDNAVTAEQSLAHVSVDIANTGIDAATATARVALSADDKLDASDVTVSAAISLGSAGGLAVGKTMTFTLKTATVPYTVKPGPAFLCVEVNPGGVAYEAKADDNVACVPVTVINQADLHLNVAHVRFRTKAGVWAENPTYGTEYGCGFVEVTNALYGAAADVPVRCWLHPLNGAKWPTDGDNWKVQWTMKGPVPGKPHKVVNINGVLKSPYSDEVAAMTGSSNTVSGPIGVAHFCAHINYDGSANEIANSGGNSVCRKITVLGPDMMVGEPHAKVGHATWKDPQPASIKRGVALNMEMVLCNKGNQVLNGVQKLKTRILLSQDKVASADDHVLHEGTGQGGYTKFNPMGTYPSGCGQLFATEKATIPLSHAAGAHFLIFDVNHDGAYIEPPQHNLVVKAVTVL